MNTFERLYKPLAAFAAVTALIGAASVASAQVQPSPLTQQLIDAAKKEGKLVAYIAEELDVANKLASVFEQKYGIKVTVERSGGERVFQRLMQEYSTGINAADFVTSSNQSHFLAWKREKMLAQYVPPDLVKWPANQRDPDGMYASGTGTLSVIAYNTKLVKAEDAPKGFKDLLDPKWKDKLVLAHPAYSGSMLSAAYLIQQKMGGWDYFKAIAAQNVMQVQSGTEPPKKVALGERAVMFGSEGTSWTLVEAGEPLAMVYPVEGTPGASGAAAILAKAPNPNAARLFSQFFNSKDGMQILSDGGYRVFHPDVTLKPTRKKLQEVSTTYADPDVLDKVTEDVKKRWAELFGT